MHIYTATWKYGVHRSTGVNLARISNQRTGRVLGRLQTSSQPILSILQLHTNWGPTYLDVFSPAIIPQCLRLMRRSGVLTYHLYYSHTRCSWALVCIVYTFSTIEINPTPTISLRSTINYPRKPLNPLILHIDVKSTGIKAIPKLGFPWYHYCRTSWYRQCRIWCLSDELFSTRTIYCLESITTTTMKFIFLLTTPPSFNKHERLDEFILTYFSTSFFRSRSTQTQ